MALFGHFLFGNLSIRHRFNQWRRQKRLVKVERQGCHAESSHFPVVLLSKNGLAPDREEGQMSHLPQTAIPTPKTPLPVACDTKVGCWNNRRAKTYVVIKLCITLPLILAFTLARTPPKIIADF